MICSDSTVHGHVYVITNSANGKRYVGQTIKTIDARFRQHCALQAKCRALESAIRKYGAECFSIAEIATASSQQELNELEAHYVREYKTIAPGGYNLRDGGGAKGALHASTKEIIRALSKQPERLAQFWAMRNDPGVIERQKQNAKIRWATQGEAVMAAARTPEAQAKRSESLRKHYAQPEASANIKRIRAEVNARPEIRAMRGKMTAALWEDPEHRAARSKNISKALLGHKKKIDYSDEAKAHRKAIAARRWADPAYKELMLSRSADPDVVKKRGDAIRAGWAKRRERLAAEKAAQE